ncbi:hypothetical protein HDU86_007333 [Geranomyces michiganensis]|nr:hypothetical protein HDU86_007333 [Geranomyces michiganensis]
MKGAVSVGIMSAASQGRQGLTVPSDVTSTQSTPATDKAPADHLNSSPLAFKARTPITVGPPPLSSAWSYPATLGESRKEQNLPTALAHETLGKRRITVLPEQLRVSSELSTAELAATIPSGTNTQSEESNVHPHANLERFQSAFQITKGSQVPFEPAQSSTQPGSCSPQLGKTKVDVQAGQSITENISPNSRSRDDFMTVDAPAAVVDAEPTPADDDALALLNEGARTGDGQTPADDHAIMVNKVFERSAADAESLPRSQAGSQALSLPPVNLLETVNISQVFELDDVEGRPPVGLFASEKETVDQALPRTTGLTKDLRHEAGEASSDSPSPVEEGKALIQDSDESGHDGFSGNEPKHIGAKELLPAHLSAVVSEEMEGAKLSSGTAELTQPRLEFGDEDAEPETLTPVVVDEETEAADQSASESAKGNRQAALLRKDIESGSEINAEVESTLCNLDPSTRNASVSLPDDRDDDVTRRSVVSTTLEEQHLSVGRREDEGNAMEWELIDRTQESSDTTDRESRTEMEVNACNDEDCLDADEVNRPVADAAQTALNEGSSMITAEKAHVHDIGTPMEVDYEHYAEGDKEILETEKSVGYKVADSEGIDAVHADQVEAVMNAEASTEPGDVLNDAAEIFVVSRDEGSADDAGDLPHVSIEADATENVGILMMINEVEDSGLMMPATGIMEVDANSVDNGIAGSDSGSELDGATGSNIVELVASDELNDSCPERVPSDAVNPEAQSGSAIETSEIIESQSLESVTGDDSHAVAPSEYAEVVEVEIVTEHNSMMHTHDRLDDIHGEQGSPADIMPNTGASFVFQGSEDETEDLDAQETSPEFFDHTAALPPSPPVGATTYDSESDDGQFEGGEDEGEEDEGETYYSESDEESFEDEYEQEGFLNPLRGETGYSESESDEGNNTTNSKLEVIVIDSGSDDDRAQHPFIEADESGGNDDFDDDSAYGGTYSEGVKSVEESDIKEMYDEEGLEPSGSLIPLTVESTFGEDSEVTSSQNNQGKLESVTNNDGAPELDELDSETP